jgi:N-acetylgalactosamine-6-sulfatase
MLNNITTSTQVNHSGQPVLFHLGRDPGERYPMNPTTNEYKTVVPNLLKIAEQHKKTMVKGEPVLNWCDDSVMNWAPEGCDKLGKCLPIPKSKPFKCDWPH